MFEQEGVDLCKSGTFLFKEGVGSCESSWRRLQLRDHITVLPGRETCPSVMRATSDVEWGKERRDGQGINILQKTSFP